MKLILKFEAVHGSVVRYMAQIDESRAKASSCLRRNAFIFSVALMGLLFLAQPCLAQNRNGSEIRGTVVDSSGAVVSDVSVDAVNVATGIHTRGVTGGTGVYDLPYVESGEYTVTFTKDNFEKSSQTGVTLHVEPVTVNAILKVGSVATQITVAGTAPLLQTESSDLNTVLPSESVTELPNVGRNWLGYTELIPGAAPGKNGNYPGVIGTAGAGATIAINGAQSYQSSWLLDGGVATLPISYNPDSLAPPIDAIAEIDMTTSNFGADQGNGLASFNVITKSGTNRFRGSLSEFVQNDAFNAAPKNWSSSPQSKPPVRWNMFGGTVGGPIVRNRLFFFFAFQSNPTRSYGHGLFTYPTDAARSGDFSDGAFATIYDPATTNKVGNTYTRQPFLNNKITTIDPVAAAMQKFFPEPNAINPNNPDYNNYYWSAVAPSGQKIYDFKVTGDLRATNHAYISGLYDSQSGDSPSPDCPLDCGVSGLTEYAYQITDAWTVSSTKVNEFRVATARESGTWTSGSSNKGLPAKIGLPNLPANNFPNLNISTGPSLNLASGVDAVLAETSIAISNTYDWILGKHTLKLGGEYDIWTDVQAWETINAGNFNFSGIATRDPNSNDLNASPGAGYADFLLGATNSWSVSDPIPTDSKASNAQVFAEDSYKVRPNLTINYGLRYLYQLGWKESQNRSSNYVPTLMNPATHEPGAIGYAGVQIPAGIEANASLFAPRVGFSYAPVPSWTIRGGFGYFGVPWSGNAYASGLGAGWTSQGAEQSIDNVNTVFQLSSGPPAPIVPTAASRTPDLLNGQNISYHPYHTPISYFEQWQFGAQHQMGAYLIQATYVGSLGAKTYFGTDINQVVALGSGIRPNPTYQSINAAQFIGSSNYNALQLSTKREFTSGFSFLANYTYSKALDTGTSGGGNNIGLDSWQDAYSPSANYAASSNDVRHMFNGTALYQLPIGKGRTFLNRGGLSDTLIGGWQLGTIFQYRSGSAFTPFMSNNLSGALSGSWYPNRVGAISVPHPNAQEWFNTSAFVEPSPNTFGNTKRNILYGPHFADDDLSLAKTFALPFLGEATNFQLKVDMFDASNHPNYGQPNFTIGSAGAGSIGYSQTNRTMQLGGIFRF